MVVQLEETFAGAGIIFTTTQPAPGTEYSTIYIGGDNSAFAEYGSFLGLAEAVDTGNHNHSEEAFVFTDTVFTDTVHAVETASTSSVEALATETTDLVTHELAHLLGYEHDEASSQERDQGSVLDDVTYTSTTYYPYTTTPCDHVELVSEAGSGTASRTTSSSSIFVGQDDFLTYNQWTTGYLVFDLTGFSANSTISNIELTFDSDMQSGNTDFPITIFFSVQDRTRTEIVSSAGPNNLWDDYYDSTTSQVHMSEAFWEGASEIDGTHCDYIGNDKTLSLHFDDDIEDYLGTYLILRVEMEELEYYSEDQGEIRNIPGWDDTWKVLFSDIHLSFDYTVPPSITVESPNGGEEWRPGTSQEITWTSDGDPGASVKIALARGTELDYWIAASTDNDGSYPWTIPEDQTPGSDYKIWVLSTSNSSYSDGSDEYFTIIDTHAPQASLTASNITGSGGTTYTFTVKYTDDVAIDVSDLNNSDIQVTGPNSFSQYATFVSVDSNSDGSPRTATYQINAPGGTWNSDDNGTYTVSMRSSQVSDTSNNYVSSGSLGTFLVSISDSNQPPSISSLSDSPDPVTQGNSLTLTANNVTDSDGIVKKVEFYRDTNGNSAINVGTDVLLATDTSSNGGWACSVITSGFPLGTNTYLARAQDDDLAWSNTVSSTGTVSSSDPGQLQVSTLVDENDENYSIGDLSLREAIELAADDNNYPGTDTITFAPSLFATGQGTITLNGSELTIDSNVAITGPGANQLVIDAAERSRAFRVEEGVTASISGLSIVGGQTVSSGAAIFNWRGTLTITDSILSGNASGTSSGGSGGAVANALGTLLVKNSIISDNYSEFRGGGIFTDRGTTTLEFFSILNNSSSNNGGGICISGGNTKIINSIITDNVTETNGGGIYSQLSATVTVINSTIADNSAGSGGGVFGESSDITLVNAIVACNTATTGNDISFNNYTISGSSNLIGTGIVTASGTNNITDGSSGNIVGTASNPIDPSFVDPAANNYHLLADSFAIDAGDTSQAIDADRNPLTTDLDGNPRIISTSVDIGAYEFDGPIPGVKVVQSSGVTYVGENGVIDNSSSSTGDIVFGGDSDTYTVVLESQPSANVVITVTPDEQIEVNSATLTFTPENWDQPQTVTVTAVDDFVDENLRHHGTIAHTATSADPNYDSIAIEALTVNVIDNDTAWITVAPSSDLITTEAGGTATFTVVLDSEPTDNVTIDLSSNDTTEGIVIPASLVFTTSNWNTPQTVTVTGVDDSQTDGNVAYTIVTAPATSSDANYNGPNASDVSVTNQDNEGAIPTPPSELTATGVSMTQVNLSWSDNSDNEDGFKIERTSSFQGGIWEQIGSVASNITRYEDAIPNYVQYFHYRVRAYNNGGDSEYSNEATGHGELLPFFNITAPTSGSYAAGSEIPILWTAGNVEEGDTISLCYDEDTIFGNDNETWIETDQVTVSNGDGSYNWNTTGVPGGTYYVAGYLSSSIGSFYSHLTQPIIIQENATGPTISSVMVVERTGPRNGELTTSESLLMTFNAEDSDGVASATVQVDGQNVTPVYGPYAAASGVNFGVPLGMLSADTHNYSIVATDNAGNPTSPAYTGTFDVAAPATLEPVIANVVIAEAGTAKNGTLESSDNLVITWSATSDDGIASKSLTVDGQAVSTIYGPYGDYYAGVFGPLAAGSHDYTIEVTDTNGIASIHNDTFNVSASVVVGPTISNVVVAEAGTAKNGTLESSDNLVITWSATSDSGIASKSLTVGGQTVSTVYGPYGDYYAGVFGPLEAGDHDYTIEVTDINGIASTHNGTFNVIAAASVAPRIGNVVV
ncbi:MAG: hypothetical protein K8R46_05985, partial [Pirellulales bacterium]|nr:hypothetical protein [Pirellulales bacterium]